jgi:hypothetical protein
MAKEILQITITSRKASKYKLVRWFQHQWFIVWGIWRPKLISKICWYLSEGILKILPKEEADKLRKEFEEVEVHIVDERNKYGRTKDEQELHEWMEDNPR